MKDREKNVLVMAASPASVVRSWARTEDAHKEKPSKMAAALVLVEEDGVKNDDKRIAERIERQYA